METNILDILFEITHNCQNKLHILNIFLRRIFAYTLMLEITQFLYLKSQNLKIIKLLNGLENKICINFLYDHTKSSSYIIFIIIV